MTKQNSPFSRVYPCHLAAILPRHIGLTLKNKGVFMNSTCKTLRNQLVGFPNIGYEELQQDIHHAIRRTWLILGGWVASLSGLVYIALSQPLP